MIIIAEKPKVAKKIAEILSKGKYKSIKYRKNVYYYLFSINNEKVYVLSALGHLFTLSTDDPFYIYPTFNYKWVPSYYEEKLTVKKHYLSLLSKFSSVKKVVIATDYDIEGELIGYNILRFVFKKNFAERMVFSAITPKDIWESFLERRDSIDVNFAIAGETRHIVDWLYGINLSRALTLAVRKYFPKVVLSIGRVQGPTLFLVYKREEEIEKFVPEVYYTVHAIVNKQGLKLKFRHISEKIKKYEDAKKIVNNSKGLAKVENVVEVLEKVDPPVPYNLSDLQQDAYRLYKISPKKTLDIAQKLYESGYVSYPRTNSQKLPKTLDYSNILRSLSNMKVYSKYINLVLCKERLTPREGKKEDVHPAIHPTGVLPKGLKEKEKLIYDLIVRRFLSIFMDPAIIKKVRVEAKIGKEKYICEFKSIKNIGWMIVYYKFVKNEFLNIIFKKHELLNVERIKISKNRTKPPSRYNQASLVKEMEVKNIGTKATRAEIVTILYKRSYIKGKSIKITPLGKKVVEIFDKHIPEILSIELTRKLEKELEEIEKGKTWKKEEVIQEAKEIVKNACEEIKNKENILGKELYEAIVKGHR